MISSVDFAKDINFDTKLPNYTRIYAVDSLLSSDLKYGLSDGKFAILRPEWAVFCPINEVPILADKLIPKVKSEVLAIYEDIKDLGLARVF